MPCLAVSALATSAGSLESASFAISLCAWHPTSQEPSTQLPLSQPVAINEKAIENRPAAMQASIIFHMVAPRLLMFIRSRDTHLVVRSDALQFLQLAVHDVNFDVHVGRAVAGISGLTTVNSLPINVRFALGFERFHVPVLDRTEQF